MLPRIKLSAVRPVNVNVRPAPATVRMPGVRPTAEMGAQTVSGMQTTPPGANPGSVQKLSPVPTEGIKGRMAMSGLLQPSVSASTGPYAMRGGKAGVSARGALSGASGQGGSTRPRISSSSDMRQRLVEQKPTGFMARLRGGGAKHTANVGTQAAAAASAAQGAPKGPGMLSKALGTLKWPLGAVGAYGAYKLLSEPSEHQQYMQSGGLPYVQM